jgi:hypothetical protein
MASLAAMGVIAAGLLSGCSQPDNPPMAEAPAFKGEPVTEPPKIPGRKQAYGASSKYQEAMERQGTR